MKKLYLYILFCLFINTKQTKAQTPLSESFDGVTFPPSNWTVRDNNSDAKTWTRGTGYPNSGAGHATYPYHSTNAGDDWLISPLLYPTSGANTFSIYVRARSGSFAEKYNIKISTTNTTVGAFTTTIAGVITITSTTYAQYNYDLSAYNDQSVYIAIQCVSVANMWEFYVDDVTGPSTTPVSVAPTVTTAAITSIGSTTATGGGEITDIGTSAVTVSGVCWNTSTDPTTSNSKSTTGPTSATTFSSEALTSLSAETYYYARAYATSDDGTGYGSNVNFWTLSTAPSGHSATFSAAVGGPAQLNLSFTAASTYGADGYIILRKTGGVAPDETGVANAVAPGSQALTGGTTLVTTITSDATTTYSNTGLTSNTQYYYCIIPYNYNGANDETYNYYTAATIPTATATTVTGPSEEGLAISDNLVNNGTIIGTNDVNYISMNGTSKTISGAGIYTDAKLYVDGTIDFDGSISSGSFSEVFINTSKSLTVNGSKTYVNTDLNNYGTLTLSANSVWNNAGDWTNGGTVTHADNTTVVSFNGGSAQAITSGGDAFENVTFANTSGGISLSDEMTINTQATFSSGIITTTSSNILTFASGATINGSSSFSTTTYVGGPVKKNTADTDPFSFPIGAASLYMPISITPSAADATVWTAQYFNSPHADTDLKTANELVYLSIKEYWDLDKSASAANATVTISWNAASGVTDVSKMLVAHYDEIAGEWESAGGTSITGNTSAGTVTSNGVWTSFSPFAPGFKANPLPVKWLNAEAECMQNSTLIKWSTASETNNEYFTIEKSLDGSIFSEMKVIPGAGNSNNTMNYSYHDLLSTGKTYYRIKQTDFDGKEEYSSIFISDCTDEYATDLVAFGNKESGQLNIIISAPYDSEYAMTITNELGQLIWREQMNLYEGINKFYYPISNQANGIYFINLYNKNENITKKIFW